MKRTMMKLMVIAMAAVMALTFTSPASASTTTKKTLTITMKNGKIAKNKVTLAPKKTGQLVVKYGGKTVTKKATYKSGNKKIVSIAKNGKLTAKKNGTATITIKYEGVSKKLRVTVHAHVWKAHYATKTVEETVVKCNCGAVFDIGQSEEQYNHMLAHLFANEPDNCWSDVIKKKVKYVNYYYCDCGARKEAK